MKTWVEDKESTVQSHFGFIHNQNDPLGATTSWQGFVAAEN
jgi:hypothetical protein